MEDHSLDLIFIELGACHFIRWEEGLFFSNSLTKEKSQTK